MTTSKDAAAKATPKLAEELKARLCAMVDSVLGQDEKEAREDFEHVLVKAKALLRRKVAMEGTKGETRDLLGELLFARLRRGFRDFQRSGDAREEIKTAEWMMGALLTMQALTEFAAALDRAILEGGTPRDYSFAGRADFISLEEVLQLLGSGKHTGCLSLEKPDNRLDVYLAKGFVAFLDPHHLARRVLPLANSMNYREISPELLAEAEARHAQQNTPLVLTLREKGFFRESELPEVTRLLGCEVLYDFLREQSSSSFFYRRLDGLPEFAVRHDLKMGVTPILLEGNKRLDEWRSLAQVFPNPEVPIAPVADMYARISSIELSVLEIKLLAYINGENAPSHLVPLMGLPLQDVYQMLVRLAREGVVTPAGGLEALSNVTMSMEESIQMAFEALDANNDGSDEVASALDKVLGGDMGGGANKGGKRDDTSFGSGLLRTVRR